MEMTKVEDLKQLLFKSLTPIISNKCAIFDLPYYKNIGDVLIWEGEISFLNGTGKKVVYSCSPKTCLFPTLDKDVTILFQGGGNIGDLYIGHTRMLSNLITKYQHHHIVVFPQTVYFKDSHTEQLFFSTLKNHRNLTFCCRDWKSHETVTKYLGERALMLPDMAFCINKDFLTSFNIPESKQSIWVKRNDVEKTTFNTEIQFDKICDWPPFEHKFTVPIVINTIFDRIVPIINSTALKKRWDKYASNNFKSDMIRTGVEFLSPYKKVYSERLHGAILSVLLDKTVIIMDNSYGKNSTFYDTWLSKFPNVELYQD